MPSGRAHPRYCAHIRSLLESHLEAGIQSRDITRFMQVSESFVSQMRSNFDMFGTVTPLPLGVQGRPRAINHEVEEGMRDFLEEYGTARLDEVCDFLFNEYDIVTSTLSVSRCLKRMDITSKIAWHVYAKQDPEIRAAYLTTIAHEYSAEQIVAIDESAANERTKDRKYGWSPKGMPCRVRLLSKRSKRWSILLALGIGGFLHYEIFHGSYNVDRFNDFIEHLLPKMTPYLGPRSVLLMDNAQIHIKSKLEALYEPHGVRVLFLLLYSLDLNPIKLLFNELKSWMKKEREISYEFGL